MIVKLKCKKEYRHGIMQMYELGKYYNFEFNVEQKSYSTPWAFPILKFDVKEHFYTPNELRQEKIRKLLDDSKEEM